MTDDRLDQILKQALAPEIDDSEIQVRRKKREHKMNMRKILAGSLVACAALAMVVAGANFNIFNTKRGSGDIASNSAGNMFAITARAAELSGDVNSGDVMSMYNEITYGTGGFTPQTFAISGENIAKIKLSTDKCELYKVTHVYPEDSQFDKAQRMEVGEDTDYVAVYNKEPEEGGVVMSFDYLEAVGNTYEGDYNSDVLFGMYIPDELQSTNSDLQASFREDVDQLSDATVTIEVTYTDGNVEVHHYTLNVGKILVPTDEEGNCQYDKLSRFLTPEEEKQETNNIYGYLPVRID